MIKKQGSNTTEFRKKIKKIAVDLHGGKCSICGYNKSIRALHFHHLNPAEKSFALSKYSCLSRRSVLLECKKCVLLCSNCHCEVEDKLIEVNLSDHNEIKNRIDQKIEDIYRPPEKPISQCEFCTKNFTCGYEGKKFCSTKCARAIQRRKNRPSKEELQSLLYEMPATKIAKIYNVSDRTIGKWAVADQLERRPRGYVKT